MAEPPPQIPMTFAIDVPPELEGGVYADFASVWHVPTHFVIDFAVPKTGVQLGEGPGGEQAAILPAKVVARVRIQPQQVIELARGLSAQLDMWEREQGQQPPSG